MRTEQSNLSAGEADDLGAVILEKKPKPLTADLFLIVAALFLIPTAILPFTADFRTGVMVGPLLAGLGAMFGTFGIVYIATNARKVSFLHKGGLRIREGKTQRTVRYPDVTEMTFKATRMYYNGAYTGTVQEIGLKTDEPGSKPVVFRHSYREKLASRTAPAETTPLNHLCNALTAQIARRMADQIQRGESAPWTNAMRINNRGVEIVGKSGAVEEVEWERIARVDLDRGVFRLWVEGSEKPRVQATVGGPNFFPGYYLVVQRLQGQPTGRAAPASASVPPAPATGALPAGVDSIRIEYTPTVEDHAALTQWYYRATPEGRKAWAVRVWTLPLIVVGFGVLFGLINLFNKDLPEGYSAAAIILVVGMLFRPLLGWLIGVVERAKQGRELRAASELARQGQGGDPFARREVSLGPEGYVIQTPHWRSPHGWNEASRIEWSKGYIFVFRAGGRVRRESTGLILPPRAFQGARGAEEAYEQMRTWQEEAQAPRRPLF